MHHWNPNPNPNPNPNSLIPQMNFFSLFSNDVQKDQRPVSEYPGKTYEEEQDPNRATSLDEHDSNPNLSLNPSNGGGWSFGGLINTFATKSESVLQTYRRDLEEFRSGLKKETAVIREIASRAVKEIPVSIEVGQAIDDFGNSVWRGTVEIFSHRKDADHESDSSDTQHVSNRRLNSKSYSRIDLQVRAIQTDLNTYCEEPEDVDGFNEWKLGFVFEEKAEEIQNLFEESGDMKGIYANLVPITVDQETFWSLYFYRVHKLKQAEDAKATLVKRVISSETYDDEESNVSDLKADCSENRDSEKRYSSDFLTEESQVDMGEKSSDRDIEGKGIVAESSSDDEKWFMEGKTDPCESSEDSDFSIVSSRTSLPEEEDIGWDEIEDLGSLDEKKLTLDDLQKQLSAADEEEYLNWDIDDDDELVRP